MFSPYFVRNMTFQKEMSVMVMLQHPCIVRAKAVVMNGDSVCGMVMELMGDDLSKAAARRPPPSAALLLKWLTEAARGIMFAHNLSVVHSVIKPDNILLTVNDNEAAQSAKLTDFGCSVVMSTMLSRTTGTRGTALYMAPEYLAESTGATQASDVFAFGMTMWKVFHPLSCEGMGDTATHISKNFDAGRRPTISDSLPTGLAELIASCWAQDARDRPTMEAVIDQLMAISPTSPTQVSTGLWRDLLRIPDPAYARLTATEWHRDSPKDRVLLSSSVTDPTDAMYQWVVSQLGAGWRHTVRRVVLLNSTKTGMFLEQHQYEDVTLSGEEILRVDRNAPSQEQESSDGPDERIRKEAVNAAVKADTEAGLARLNAAYADPVGTTEPTRLARVVLGWHGSGVEVLPKICECGPRNLRTTDAGFFGSGSYFALEADYASVYSTTNRNPNTSGEYGVILYAISVAQTHVVTLHGDYRAVEDPNKPDIHGFSCFYSGDTRHAIDLAPKCDSHFIPVKAYTTHPLTGGELQKSAANPTELEYPIYYQAVPEQSGEAEGHELVIKSHFRCVPLAIVYFT
jgi:serine/threonine protein kinase